ncbi:MAG: hypothetical protein K2N88_02610 [Muribaculaceae bacterium]|nr:hypothetical protein [Muribaculaceae bacterium]
MKKFDHTKIEQETLEAKIRNRLSPILTLADLLEVDSYTSEQKEILIEKYNMLQDIRKSCDELIELGKEVNNGM